MTDDNIIIWPNIFISPIRTINIQHLFKIHPTVSKCKAKICQGKSYKAYQYGSVRTVIQEEWIQH